MSELEELSHMERKITQLRSHVSQQDAEIFRLSKLVDSLTRKVEKLEGRLNEGGVDSPLDRDEDPLTERPPHY
jgi:uncharacterized coiled-coil protein SlyX